MIKPTDKKWNKIKNYINKADSIAFDDCHKIYILMDSTQTDRMFDLGYEDLFEINNTNKAEAYALLREWYYNSCSLRFIEAVKTVNQADSFETLIPQSLETDDGAIEEYYAITEKS